MRYALDQPVVMNDDYVESGSARKGEDSDLNFSDIWYVCSCVMESAGVQRS
jgi:hypothetical protein